MERIVLYNVKHSENIIKSASNMRIKSIVLSEDMTSKTLKDVLDSAKDYKSGDDIFYNEAKAGIVIFCNVTDKHMDKLLFELRNGSSKADYFEAVLGADDLLAAGKIERAVEYFEQNKIPKAETVMIGDSVHDFDVSQALGIDCILMSGGHQDLQSLQSCGCPVITSFQDHSIPGF